MAQQMGRNVGKNDRLIRVVVGGLLFAAGIGMSSIVPAAIGAVLLLTATTGVCPLYCMFGLSTCPVKRS